MKCPKCGYNSFEFLDQCKKCNSSLSAFKQSVGLRPVVLPLGASIASAAGIASGPADELISSHTVPETNGDDIFQWDVSSAAPATPAATSGIEDFDLNLDAEPKPAIPLTSDPFSFDDDLFKAPSSQPAQAATSPLEEFSFDLTDYKTSENPPQEEVISIESQGVPLNAKTVEEAFGEFSFDLPDNTSADVFAQKGGITPESSLSLSKESEDISFGEFSFDDSPHPEAHATNGTAVSTGPDDQRPASPFSLDAFGDLDETALKEEANSPSTGKSGEFELDSFLAMQEPLTPAKASGKPHPAGDAQLSAGDFDSIFSELQEPGKKH